MLRIIAGELRGRRIRVARVDGLRPTGERVREALFSILGDRVRHARVLDAYAGSGALGFEALSRGAASVVFIESAPAAVRELTRSADHLGVAARTSVLRGRTLELLGSDGHRAVRGPFDLVFADPPWTAQEGSAVVLGVGQPGVLAGDGLLILERSARESTPETTGLLAPVRTARYGDTALDFFAHSDAGSAES